MKINTRVRYGTRALLDIARHSAQGPVPLRDVAERQRISLYYLEQVALSLKSAGIVRSVRGARGGFTLGRDPSEIKISSVVEALGGTISLVDCLADSTVCDFTGDCVTRDLWRDVKAAMDHVLSSRTVKDLLECQLNKQSNIDNTTESLAQLASDL